MSTGVAATRHGGAATYIEHAEGKMRVELSPQARSVISKKLAENAVPGATSPFWARGGACLDWTGSVGSEGQAVISVVGQTMSASRAAYLAMVGPVDLDENGRPYDVHRLCRNKLCINVAHFEAITHRENLQRENARLTHCPSGHERTPENLARRKKGDRYTMVCLTCDRATKARYLARKKAELAAA